MRLVAVSAQGIRDTVMLDELLETCRPEDLHILLCPVSYCWLLLLCYGMQPYSSAEHPLTWHHAVLRWGYAYDEYH